MLFENYLQKRIPNRWIKVNIQYFFIGIIIGVFLNIMFRLIGRNSAFDWKDILSTFIFSILITLSITNVSVGCALISKKQFKSPVINVGLNYILIFLGVVIGSEIGFLFVAWLYDVPFGSINQLKYLKFNSVLGLVVGTILYIYQLQHDNYDLKLKDKELQLTKLSELKTQADLRTLQARINPHFLYNSLNSIASLIHDEPAKAEDMTIKLSRLFRYSINTQEANWATVKEEMEVVSTYLDIERVRFGNRITFKIHADEGISEFMIPRFLLQPLVENALKHGLKNKSDDGKLIINIQDIGDQVDISVSDNGIPFPAEMTVGYGLQSTYDKLNLLYKDLYKVNIVNGSEKKIVITLPKHTQK